MMVVGVNVWCCFSFSSFFFPPGTTNRNVLTAFRNGRAKEWK